jgi:hypothetical protein
MNYRLFSIAVVVAGMALLFAPATAQAAKGQKKNPAGAEAEHKVHGEIIAVHHEKGKDHVTITVRTHAHKKKNAAANAVVKGKGKKSNEHTFTVSSRTQIFIDHGKRKTHSNIGHLKAGEHVSLLAHGHHADVIDIQEGGKKVAAVKKKVAAN